MKRQATAAFGPGYFGKLPARGDYLARGLPPTFLDPWENWLHGVWHSGHQRFGEVWSPLIADGPAWRFVLDEDVCGPDAVAGLLIPSCDKLGRVFPLSLAAAIPGRSDPAALPITASDWYGRAEDLLRKALTPDFNLESFEKRLRELGTPRRAPPLTQPKGSPGWHVALDPVQAPAISYPALIHDLAATLPDRFSLWWTLGTRRVGPSLVVASGLPDSAAVTAFWDGAWDYWGWTDGDALYPEEE